MFSKLLPTISVITPSFNQGQFIEDTILSVLGQGYPNLEYIIIDGGSTDNTVDIIKKYEDRIAYWVSEGDNGQSHAINKGFERATGDILCWLNSDDLFMPGVLLFISKLFDSSQPAVYFGNCIQFFESETLVDSAGSDVMGLCKRYNLNIADYIIQPSTFWSRETWNIVGKLREDLHFAFDWEWFLRAEQRKINLIPISKCLSMYRIHDKHKTGAGGIKRQEEILDIYNTYNQKVVNLYRSLMSEPGKLIGKRVSLITWLFSFYKKPATYGTLLKLLKPAKYKQFSIAEINFVRTML